MNWLLMLLIVAAVAVLVRIYFSVRKLRNAADPDWDAKQIESLRAQGSDPFQPHAVDFFFALPNESACQALRSQLETDGFETDTKVMHDSADHPFSLHACKSLRLSVPGMKELSNRFATLARTHGGRYDGWAAAVVPQTGNPATH